MSIKSEPYVVEEQTGRVFEVKTEGKADRLAAIIGVVYLIIMTLFFLWQLFDIWVGKMTFAKILGYLDTEQVTESTTLVILYTFLGGALGALVNEIRGFIFWHCEHGAYGGRYIWKSLLAPWLGGTLGLFVYFLTRSGIGLFTGEFIPTEQTAQQAIPMFTIGALAGYGSRKVFIWLDHQVTRLFRIKAAKKTSEEMTKVPNLVGMEQEEAKNKLAEAKLELGEVDSETTDKPDMVGKVIAQGVNPDLSLAVGSRVDIIIGVAE